jgi:hypothetical protein
MRIESGLVQERWWKYGEEDVEDVTKYGDGGPWFPLSTGFKGLLPTTELLVQVPSLRTISQFEI